MTANYIHLAQGFWRNDQKDGAFSGSETRLYFRLLSLFSDAGEKANWPDAMRFRDDDLCLKTGFSRNTLFKVRSVLCDRRLIDYAEVGKGNRAGAEYRLMQEGEMPKRCSKNEHLTPERCANSEQLEGKRCAEIEQVESERCAEIEQLSPKDVQKDVQILNRFYIYKESKPFKLFIPNKIERENAGANDSEIIISGSQNHPVQAAPAPLPPAPVVRTDDPFFRKRNAESVNVPFSQWWPLYGYGVNESRCRTLWVELSDAERDLCLLHTPQYVAANPEKRYRKSPENYLADKTFNDEIIPRHGNNHRQSSRNYQPKPAREAYRFDLDAALAGLATGNQGTGRRDFDDFGVVE